MIEIVYAAIAFYPDTSSIVPLGTLGSEGEARDYAARGTRYAGDSKAMKIVRQVAGANSGDVVAFYRGGVEVSYEETLRKSGGRDGG